MEILFPVFFMVLAIIATAFVSFKQGYSAGVEDAKRTAASESDSEKEDDAVTAMESDSDKEGISVDDSDMDIFDMPDRIKDDTVEDYLFNAIDESFRANLPPNESYINP